MFDVMMKLYVYSSIIQMCVALALTRGPLQLSLAQEMQMQMVDGLGTIRAVIDNHSESLVQALLFGHLAAHQQQMAEQCAIVVGRLGQLGNGFARYDEEMHRRLWIHIVEGHALQKMGSYVIGP